MDRRWWKRWACDYTGRVLDGALSAVAPFNDIAVEVGGVRLLGERANAALNELVGELLSRGKETTDA